MESRVPLTSPQLDPKRIPEPTAFIDSLGAFALDGSEAQLRPAEAAPDRVLGFSDFSRPETIRIICMSKVPGWSVFTETDLIVDQLLEGLSNQLFKVHIAPSGQRKFPASTLCVLFRIFGKEVGAMIDAPLELKIFQTLASYQIAPKMYAHDVEWRIEEWHYAVALKTRLMRNPSILTQVSSSLGRLHKLSARHDFPRDLRSMSPLTLQRMQSWGSSCEGAAAKQASEPEASRALEQLNLPELLAEKAWLASFIVADDPHIKGSGLDIVFSHLDLQENNILQTQYGLRLIDFEYAGMDFQALDIANYFCECTLDYLSDKYPFYKQTNSDYPTEWEQRLFCSIYLSEYLESTVMPEDLEVTRLLARVQRFTLVSHYMWTLWSILRAPCGVTYNDFDFLHFGQARWDSYKRAKAELLASPEDLPPKLRTPTNSQADLQSEMGGRTPSKEASRQDMDGPAKPSMPWGALLGGALTGGGVLVGVLAVVLSIKLIKR